MTSPSFQQQITFLYVRDLARSADFYGRLLGLPLALDQGSCRIYRVGRDAFLGLCVARQPERGPAGVIVTLVSADVDGWARYLTDQGVALDKAPVYNPRFNIYHLFLRDPDGYTVEIQRFLDPAWPTAAL